MNRWLGLLIIVALTPALSAAITGPFTALRVLSQALVLGGLLGPIYLLPRRYAEWGRRCRLPGFRRRV